MEARLIIVVGTTPDYVAKIQEEEKIRQLLFLLDNRFKNFIKLKQTENSHLIFSDLASYNETLETLDFFISGQDRRPCFACFDCETLYLASRLAEHFNCPFPSPDAVLKSRNKFLSSRLWAEYGIPTPECGLASDVTSSVELFNRFNRNTVIKPLTGSGSELVFHCTEEQDVINAAGITGAQLERRRGNPLFARIPDPVSGEMIDPCRLWLVEEYVDGPEYSCDFFMDSNGINILRETEKIKDSDYPFGTVSGYMIPPSYPGGNTGEDIKTAMMKSAAALGFTWGYFMADFIVRNNQISIIELTPRPGGDSLPELIRESTGADIVKTYLDIMAGDTVTLGNIHDPPGSYASIHLFADREGIIADIDTEDITVDPRTRALFLKKNRGDRITLPPNDYDNRLLGYCVVSREPDDSSLMMCRDIQKKMKVKYSILN